MRHVEEDDDSGTDASKQSDAEKDPIKRKANAEVDETWRQTKEDLERKGLNRSSKKELRLRLISAVATKRVYKESYKRVRRNNSDILVSLRKARKGWVKADRRLRRIDKFVDDGKTTKELQGFTVSDNEDEASRKGMRRATSSPSFSQIQHSPVGRIPWAWAWASSRERRKDHKQYNSWRCQSQHRSNQRSFWRTCRVKAHSQSSVQGLWYQARRLTTSNSEIEPQCRRTQETQQDIVMFSFGRQLCQ